MQLDPKALKGAGNDSPAFAQLRKIAGWMDPTTAAQHYSVHLPKFIKGDDGHADDGRLGAGRDQESRRQARRHADRLGAAGRRQALLRAQRRFDDLLEAPRSRPAGRPAAARQADDAEGRAGEVLADHRLDPGAHRRRPVGPGLVGRPARGGGGADRGLQEQARAAQPRPQHGAAQPDLGGHDRRHHRVHPQRQGEPRAGRGAAGPAVDNARG